MHNFITVTALLVILIIGRTTAVEDFPTNNINQAFNKLDNSIHNPTYGNPNRKAIWPISNMWPVCKGRHCTCSPGYKLHSGGKLCEPLCEGGCDNGYCHHPNTCECYDGYVKMSPLSNACAPNCTRGCHGGNCVAPEVCVCKPGYVRSPLTFECLPLCRERCVNGYCSEPNRCSCNPGYKKKEGTRECVPKCSGGCKNGICKLPETCVCKTGYKKVDDQCTPKCSPQCVNGDCVAPNQCRCNINYVKDTRVLTGNVCVHMNLIGRY
ncbi:hypothetical protein C0J52_08204 [Blattella germanica]|nr:hypothetical protein C0J52_08204 [Blattella germanica]